MMITAPVGVTDAALSYPAHLAYHMKEFYNS